MMAAEVVKIKVAQQIAQKEDVEAHTFTFHERLNQLKSDIGKIWFFGYDETNVTDLKKYVERFSKTYSIGCFLFIVFQEEFTMVAKVMTKYSALFCLCHCHCHCQECFPFLSPCVNMLCSPGPQKDEAH